MSARCVLRAACVPALAVVVLILSSGNAAAQSCLIELTGTDAAVHFDGMAPGDRRAWWTSVRNTSGDDVELSVRLTGSGALAAALELTVHGCDEPWLGHAGGTITCPGAEDQLLAPSAVGDLAGTDLDLGSVPDDGRWHVRFTAAMRHDAGDEFQAASGTALATFEASGDGGTCTLPPPDDEDEDSGDDGPETSAPPTTPPTMPTTTALPQRPADPGGTPDGPRSPRREPDRPGGPRGPLVVTGGQIVGPLVIGVAMVGAGALADLCRRRRNRDPHRRGS